MVKPVNKPDATLKLALVNGEVRLISFDTTVDFELELYDMDFHRSAYAREEVCYCLDIDDGGHVHCGINDLGTFEGGKLP
jgi:hypothetical protein